MKCHDSVGFFAQRTDRECSSQAGNEQCPARSPFPEEQTRSNLTRVALYGSPRKKRRDSVDHNGMDQVVP